jgi:glycosyltransferase involved in cell wall biosynthesis
MKVIQILPELDAGGVERGTLEVAAHLVANGHDAVVISNGGRLVPELTASGARHITLPVQRKSLASLWQVGKLRRLLVEERADILHIRSRVPGWLGLLAWRGLDPALRPRLVSTVHGFYSVNRYSAVMTMGEAVIAVSESVRDYIHSNYPATDHAKIRVIHRGVDETLYHPGHTPPGDWLNSWHAAHPQLAGRIPLLLPGRLTRWKGQEHFIRLIARLLELGRPVHGLIVGAPHAKKLGFLDELKELAASLGVAEHVTFLGHRGDLREIMAVSALVYSLSTDAEAFGRVSLEALALGKPVVGYAHGGVAEQLQVIFPAGMVALNDEAAVLETTIEILDQHLTPGPIGPFTLQRMLDSTLEVYQSLLDRSGRHAP